MAAYLGPVGCWYGFWMSPTLRVAFLTTALATLLWTTSLMLAAQAPNGWIGGAMAAAGACLVTLTALPDWVHVLRALDRPLNVAPATDTMLFARYCVRSDSIRISAAFGAAYIVPVTTLSRR